MRLNGRQMKSKTVRTSAYYVGVGVEEILLFQGSEVRIGERWLAKFEVEMGCMQLLRRESAYTGHSELHRQRYN